jgi:hypothetical protein
MLKRVSKILLLVDNHYVFSEKRAPESSEKDHKLELIGGALNEDESAFQGLIRELQEEEQSGLLSKKAEKLNLSPKEIVVKNEPHFIYRMEISNAEYKEMIHSTDESYGFHLVQDNIILDKNELRENISRFTPKTIKIFQALDMV